MRQISDLKLTIQSMEGELEQSQKMQAESEEAMQQMQETLMKKGEVNARLSETVNTIKNKILEEEIFSLRFIVQ